jgi:hypothetical protein
MGETMRFDDLGDVTAYICVPLTLFVSYRFVLPWLSGWSRAYYLFLMAWSAPYIIGNVCDVNKIGSRWTQWHLLDVSYEPWAMTLGATIYVLVMQVARRAYTQRSIMICSVISLPVFAIMAYGYEVRQSWQAWQVYGSTIDWSDYIAYAVGSTIAVIPFIAFRQLRLLSAQPS